MVIAGPVIRVLLADNHRMVAEGLVSLLAAEPSIDVVGLASTGDALLEAIPRHRPDVVLLDVVMGGLNGIDTALRVRSEWPEVRTIALSMYSDARFVSGMIAAGAQGYVLKDEAFVDLVAAIRSVYAGGRYFSPRVRQVIVDDYATRVDGTPPSIAPGLTDRERQVLQLLAEGCPLKGIAARLGLSVKTIESHRRNLMDKIDLHSVAQLTKYAIREGLTRAEP